MCDLGIADSIYSTGSTYDICILLFVWHSMNALAVSFIFFLSFTASIDPGGFIDLEEHYTWYRRCWFIDVMDL